jgi:predicted short-subunit dehydrogenase-like oxidoreductase (DUF2520 family)
MNRGDIHREAKGRSSVSVVGLGNWGSSLVNALRVAGAPLREIVVRSEAAAVRERRRLRRTGGPRIATLAEAELDAEFLWLCVPDAAIARTARQVARQLARRGRGRRAGAAGGQIVLHSSGALSRAILAPLGRHGLATASAHPLMSFPGRDPVSIEGVGFAVEAEPPVRRRIATLVRRIGGRPFRIDGEAKALYHAAGAMASPLLVAHLAAAEEAAALAGIAPRRARQLIGAIARASLENAIRQGAERSFSGPFARGDSGTVLLHLQALGAHPFLDGVYRGSARYALEGLPIRRRRALLQALNRA